MKALKRKSLLVLAATGAMTLVACGATGVRHRNENELRSVKRGHRDHAELGFVATDRSRFEYHGVSPSDIVLTY